MKNRKRIVVAFLLVAVMLLGIGYAAITGQLTITGNLTTGVQPFDVVFTQVKVDNIVDTTTTDKANPTLTIEKNDAAVGETITIGTTGLPSVSFTATGLAEKGDSIVLTFTIMNRNKMDMYVTPAIKDSTLSVFKVSSDWNGAQKKIEAGKTMTYTLTVLLDQHVDAEIGESFTIDFASTSTVPTQVNP